MDLELSQSTLIESFERYDPNSYDVDIEKNLLTNLLESHASQMGVAGPASNLLSQLGLQMPSPPSSAPLPSTTKSSRKQNQYQQQYDKNQN